MCKNKLTSKLSKTLSCLSAIVFASTVAADDAPKAPDKTAKESSLKWEVIQVTATKRVKRSKLEDLN
jgi:hypothetical protein